MESELPELEFPYIREAEEDLKHFDIEAKRAEARKGRTLNAWITPFSKLHTLPVFKRVWFYLAIMALYTILIHFIDDRQTIFVHIKEAYTIGYANLVLGLLLVFRTNSAYERWSEGRRLWGQLMNESRSVTLKVSRLIDVPEIEKKEFSELVISFAYALKHHLRDAKPSQDLPGIKPNDQLQNTHVPVHVTDTKYQFLYRWYKAGFIDSIILTSLDKHLCADMDITGACERIRSTPLAMSYRAFIRQGIALNLFSMPLYTASALPMVWAVPLTIIASYFLIGLEMIAEEIEDPFGHDIDDLPLDTICERICVTVHEIMRREPTKTKESDLLKYTSSFPAPKINLMS